MPSLLLQTTLALAEEAAASGDQFRAEEEITKAVQQCSVGQSRLPQDVVSRYPQVAWRVGAVRMLGEFGRHKQPVRALAFTTDGKHLVSADDTEVMTWDIATRTQVKPVCAVPIAGTRGLSPDGLLALSEDGTLRRTDDGHQVSQVGAIASHAFSSDGSLLAWASRRTRPLSQDEWLHNHTIQAQFQYLESSYRASPIESSKVDGAQIDYPDGRRDLHFIDSLHVTDIESGQQISATALSKLFIELGVSERSQKMAALTPEGQVLVTDISSGITQIPMFSVDPVASLLNSVVFSPGGDLIVVAQALQG